MKALKQTREFDQSLTERGRDLLRRRAERLVKLLRMDAPDIVLAAEVGLLVNAVKAGGAQARI